MPAPAPTTFHWVPGVSALCCEGASPAWVTASVVPPPPPVTWAPGLAPCGWLPLLDDCPDRAVQAPPDPPPR